MQTFYVDIYFLINFTVNILALYFAALFTRITSTTARLILSGAFSAFMACVVAIFVPKGIFFFFIFVFGTWLTVEIFAVKTGIKRKLKLYFGFIIFETFLGGFVNLIYNLLDTYVYPLIANETFGAENRNLLLLSLIVFLAYALLKLLFTAFYTSKCEKNIEITVSINNIEEKITGLVDSGLMACDPLDSKPVIIVKKNSLASTRNLGNISNCSNIEIKKRIRVIPIKTLNEEKILFGIRSDYVKIKGNSEKYENIVIALDEEGGSFGGYTALVPLSLLE